MVSKRTWRGMSCVGFSVRDRQREQSEDCLFKFIGLYILIQGGLCTALGQALIHVTSRDPFRASKLIVHGWLKRGSTLTVDCVTVNLLSLMMLLITLSLLTIPMVSHVLINRHVVCLKFTQSSDRGGDQSFGRSSNGFPGSHANWSCNI
jgi:hypothetical protein